MCKIWLRGILLFNINWWNDYFECVVALFNCLSSIYSEVVLRKSGIEIEA